METTLPSSRSIPRSPFPYTEFPSNELPVLLVRTRMPVLTLPVTTLPSPAPYHTFDTPPVKRVAQESFE